MRPTLPGLIFLLTIVFLITSCVRTGDYRYGGAFLNAQLPVIGKKIGVLDPRGPYGDAEATRVMYRTLKQTIAKCPGTKILTEEGMNDRGELPPIYGERLSEENLAWFIEKTDIDFIVFLDIGPGKFEGDTTPRALAPADREASAILIVYDLNHQSVFKEIIVNGSLNLDLDLQLWETEASEADMALVAMKKALKKLRVLSDCS